MKQHAPGRASRRERAGSLFWSLVSVFFGWTLFVYWWYEVMSQDQPAALLDLLVAIAFFALLLVLSTFLWIGHNQEIARMGTRGSSSPYRVPVFRHDALDRPLVLPADVRSLRDEAVIHVDLRGDSKVYSPGRIREADEASG